MMLERRLDNLSYDFRDFTIESFTQHVEEMIDKKIFLIPITMTADYSGFWLSDAELPHEYIFIASSLSPILSAHTILHELSHIILGHKTTKITQMEIVDYINALKPIPVDAALRAQIQSTSASEEDAESLASRIWQRAISRCDTLGKSSLRHGDKYLSLLTTAK